MHYSKILWERNDWLFSIKTVFDSLMYAALFTGQTISLIHCCNACSTHNPSLIRCIQTVNLCTYISYIFTSFTLWLNCLICTYEQTLNKHRSGVKIKITLWTANRSNTENSQFKNRWEVLPSHSTYITRPRWIYSWRPCIQKSVSVQAVKLVVFCDYFLYSHVLDRRSEDCQSVTCTAPLGQKNWKCATLLLSTFLYSTSFLFVSFYFGLFYFYIFSFFSRLCSRLSKSSMCFFFFWSCFPSVRSENNNLTNEAEEKEEGRLGCQSHPCRRRMI